MERREFLKLTLGLTAAAGAMVATATAAQAAPMLPQAGDAAAGGQARRDRGEAGSREEQIRRWRRTGRIQRHRHELAILASPPPPLLAAGTSLRYWRRRRWGRRIYY